VNRAPLPAGDDELHGEVSVVGDAGLRGVGQAQKRQRPPERIGWAQLAAVWEELTLCDQRFKWGFRRALNFFQ
jgi:hypothetical protein